jgi:RNA polymerase sigma factor (sigma-70 family)
MLINNQKLTDYLRSRFQLLCEQDITEIVAYAESYIWEVQKDGRVVEKPDAYAMTIVQRLAIATIRRNQRHLYPDTDEEDAITWDDLCATCGMLTDSYNPEDDYDAEAVLHEAPEHYAQVLRMHYLEGLDLAQVAKETGLTPACVRKRHERALKWARKYFEHR